MKKKVWLIPAAVLSPFAIVSLFVGRWLRLSGASWWVLTIGLWVLGLVAAGLLFLFLRAKARAAGPGPAEDEVDRIFGAVRQRLAATRAGGSGRLGKLPAIVVMGPRGSTKTTTLMHSGLEPEHLAGELRRGDVVVPTPAVNVWYSQGTVLVEAGGELTDAPERWAHLTRHLRPSRWAATFSRRAQAPRQVLVCFSCDELLKPGASQQVPGAAQQLRARLLELSAGLGTRLPVYVLFTKADRLPYFIDYVRSFSRDEAQEVLGTTLPAAEALLPGSYADIQGRRLTDAFGRLVHSLSLRRLEVLPRETAAEVRAGAYEFPRELRKVSDLAVQFLLELCKPSQLGVSPFLRGFYFTGVRPVVVSDVVAAAAPPPPQSGQIALGATSVFNPQGLQQAMQAASATPSSRKLPEWVFLQRLFREVVLRDDAAKRVTAGGTRVNHLRRSLAVAATVLFLILGTGFTVSYLGNHRLIGNAMAAARGAAPLQAAVAEAPGAPALRALDALRAQAALVGGFERDGHPWRLAWGLYTGDALHPELRTLYFDRFERLLWANTRADLLDSLHVRSDAPDATSEYGRVYNDLKAYLITTSHPEESTPDFLAPVLERHWADGRGIDSARAELAQRQFVFYAGELPFGNPYPATPNEAVVANTRAYLARFADVERLYQVLLSEASKATPAVRFAGTPGVAVDPVVVPGAFTTDGWKFVQASLKDVNRLFARERWVTGEHEVSSSDRAKLAQELRTRYVADYIKHWQDYLHAGAVAAGAGPGDAALKLAQLSGNASPLLQMLAIASQNTAVDTTAVGPAFQPVHQVVSPAAKDRYVGDSNAAYIAALGGLQMALKQVATSNGPMQLQALGQASAAAEQARGEVRKLAQGFDVAGDAGVAGAEVVRLLQAPLGGLDAVLGGVPAAGVNQKGQSFCAAFRPLTSKYPFNPDASAAATVDDVSAALMPGSSVLWSFYQDALGDILTKQGTRYAVKPGATVQPTAAFVDFFNRAARAASALYDSDGSGPEVVFSMRAQTSDEVPEVTVSIDGQTKTFTRTDAASKTFDWNAARPAPARISARLNGVDVTLVDAPAGAWSVFHLFQNAQWQSMGGGRYTVRWRAPGLGQPLTAEISFAKGEPVFMRDYLAHLGCVSKIAR
ncbi:MAG TPA: ImcF-related family protein [Longimicrobiaceae bacterium]|nr:ImcF-related family protein [Longimicrobiaceae bacterium]